MISAKKIKMIVKNESEKRISKKAIAKINNLLEEKAEELIRKAIKNSDFSGRKTIKEEDI